MNLSQTDRKWIDAMQRIAQERNGEGVGIVKTFSPNPRDPQPDVDAYKTLKAFLELYVERP